MQCNVKYSDLFLSLVLSLSLSLSIYIYIYIYIYILLLKNTCMNYLCMHRPFCLGSEILYTLNIDKMSNLSHL